MDLYCSQWATYCEDISTIKLIDGATNNILVTYTNLELKKYLHVSNSESNPIEQLKVDFLETGNITDWNFYIPAEYEINGVSVPI